MIWQKDASQSAAILAKLMNEKERKPFIDELYAHYAKLREEYHQEQVKLKPGRGEEKQARTVLIFFFNPSFLRVSIVLFNFVCKKPTTKNKDN